MVINASATLTRFCRPVEAVARGVAAVACKQLRGATGESWVSGGDQSGRTTPRSTTCSPVRGTTPPWHPWHPNNNNNTEVLSRADLPSIHTLLKKAQVRWAGHIVRMPNTRLPKRLFYGELTEGKRSQGGQKKRYKDTLKVSLKSFNISPNTWEIEALNRPVWRSNTSKGATSYEQNRIAEARRKRVLRKSRDNSMVADHLCPTCGRGFRARIGLISHSRTHRTRSYSTQWCHWSSSTTTDEQHIYIYIYICCI